MKIFLTGAAGFIGSRVAKTLLARGDEIVGIDNFDPYYDRVHKDRHLRDLIGQKGFTFIEGDLRNAALLKELFAQHRPAAVAHLAAMAAVRFSTQHPLIYGEVNVQGTMNLLDAARQLNAMPPVRCVLASTGSVYGTSTPVPFKEDAAADRPLAPYPASKRAMELMAHCYAHLWKLPMTVLRFFNVYGPHGRPDMMPWQWTQAILAGKPLTLFNAGHLKRDWTYIDDIVAGFVAALDATGTKLQGYEILNLGCGNPVENVDFVATLEKILGKKAVIQDTPVPASEPIITYADVAKAGKMLAYKPKVQVEEGLGNFVKWMREEKII